MRTHAQASEEEESVKAGKIIKVVGVSRGEYCKRSEVGEAGLCICGVINVAVYYWAGFQDDWLLLQRAIPARRVPPPKPLSMKIISDLLWVKRVKIILKLRCFGVTSPYISHTRDQTSLHTRYIALLPTHTHTNKNHASFCSSALNSCSAL